MNFFVWFGIFVIVAVIAVVCAAACDYKLDVLSKVMIVVFAIAIIMAILCGIVGLALIPAEHDISYEMSENKIRKSQLESYIVNVEYPKALEQMYFDDIMEFNYNVHHAEKYGDKWMMRWILYNPSYIGIEPIDLEGFE